MAKTKKESNNDIINKEELIKDIKKSLDEEISNKVEYEARNKLDKMERRIYRQKRWAIIRRDFIILVFLVLIGYESKLLYDNGLLFKLNKKELKEEETVEVIEKEEVKDKDWYIKKYSYLLDKINTNLDSDKYYLYLDSYKVSDIKNSVKLNIAYQLLDNVSSVDGIIRISEDDLKQSYLSIFNDEYKAENFSNDCINFIYNNEFKSYMAIDSKCSDITEEIYRKIINIYEESDKVIIEAKVGVFNKDKKTISIINGDSYEYNDENIDKLNTYKFVFKNINDKYYFYKIENK